MREDDREWMQQALVLAQRGAGHVSPNPLVGCVLVREGKVIGEGAHEFFGGPHAEANALEQAKNLGHDTSGATAYITLEPCTHVGKTPPCADRLVAADIRRCVIATRDPNPKVSGHGAELLMNAGIETEIGLMEQEAQDLARFFFKHVTTGRPFVTMKIAQSLDGRSALKNGRSRWITSEASRKRVHEMRARFDTVLVGSNTVLADDPELNVRLVEGRSPLRIVIDSQLRLPLGAKVFQGSSRTIVATLVDDGDRKAKQVEALRSIGVEVMEVEANAHGAHIDLDKLFRILGQRNIQSILVEAGPTLALTLIQGAYLDELAIFQAPVILGGDAAPAVRDLGLTLLEEAPKFSLLECTKVEESSDCFLRYRVG